MNFRFVVPAIIAVLFSACSDQANGQRGQSPAIKTVQDSISYGIGTQVGQNLRDQFRASGMDSLNSAALAAGVHDALDSTMLPSSEKMVALVQTYMLDVQRKQMQKQQQAAEAAVKANEEWMAANGKKPGVVTTASGLQYEVITTGKGPKPSATDEVVVHYRGTLIDGKQFENSYDRGQPANLKLTEVIPGWVEGIQLMPTGSKWRFYIPQNLAWGAQGAGADIPPYSAVIFDIELLDIKK